MVRTGPYKQRIDRTTERQVTYLSPPESLQAQAIAQHHGETMASYMRSLIQADIERYDITLNRYDPAVARVLQMAPNRHGLQIGTGTHVSQSPFKALGQAMGRRG
jgi:uncharacterized membrane protein